MRSQRTCVVVTLRTGKRVRMAEVGAIFPRSDAPKSRYRGWRRSDAGFADRFRKSIVAATLACGDIVPAIVAVSLSRAVMGMTGAQPPGPHLPLKGCLLLMFFFVAR